MVLPSEHGVVCRPRSTAPRRKLIRTSPSARLNVPAANLIAVCSLAQRRVLLSTVTRSNLIFRHVQLGIHELRSSPVYNQLETNSRTTARRWPKASLRSHKQRAKERSAKRSRELQALFCRRRHQPRRPPLQLAIAMLKQKRADRGRPARCKLVIDQERELSTGELTTATPR